MTRRNMLLSLGAFLAAGAAFLTARPASANGYYQGPVSDHFDGTIFFNPNGTPPGAFRDLLRWQLSGEKQSWPTTRPSSFPKAKPVAKVGRGDMVITHIGHASFLFQIAGANILADPVWSERTSPVSFAGPKRVNAPGIAFEDLPKIDVVLITHNHYDHMDMATLERLVRAYDPLIITPLGNDTIIKADIPTARILVMDWGQSYEHAAENGSLIFHCEPCHHWSARGSRDRRHALWAAFVIESGAGRLYHIGDTGFHGGINYKAAREKFGSFDVATLPIGAYEPRWFMQGQHQNPAEAVEGLKLLGAKRALGHHWGTVQLTDEAIDAPKDALFAALDKAGLAREVFLAVEAGQVVEIKKG
jgi:L-ascorbate metabolism protein UlaG (beta-lactamase superfamily)